MSAIPQDERRRRTPREPLWMLLLRWTLPTIVLFGVLTYLAYRISHTAAKPFVYDF